MDGQEFRRILNLFPTVRSPNYHADSESSGQSTSQSGPNEEEEWQDAWDDGDKKEDQIEGIIDHDDAFWRKVKLAVEKKIGPSEAEDFCKAFQSVHKKLVYEELSLDAAKRFLASSKMYRSSS